MNCQIFAFLLYTLGLHRSWFVTAEENDITGNSSISNRYCFRFTWIGAYMDYDNIDNELCPSYHNIPCTYPIMATSNNNVPDTDKLWRENFTDPYKYGCLMKSGYSCIRYTYTFKQGIQNITYMCAKVNTTDGCYRQKDITGTETEVCVCHSEEGEMPCNSTAALAACYPILLAIILIIFTTQRESWRAGNCNF